MNRNHVDKSSPTSEAASAAASPILERISARDGSQQLRTDELYAKECADVKVRAQDIWERSADIVGDHKYLQLKEVRAHGARVYQGKPLIDGSSCYGALVVPIQDSEGDVCQLQLILPDGKKRFLRGPKPRGSFYVIGVPGDVLCVAKGFATAASIHETTGHAVAIAFDCANLRPVADAIRLAAPETKIVICADDDYQTPSNPGLTMATAAALATGSFVAIPDFGADRPDGCTDFNELARIRGASAVRACVKAAHRPEAAPTRPTSPTPTKVEGEHPPESRTKTDEAGEWLRELLKDGPVQTAVALKEAKAAGITDKALRSARERLNVKPSKAGYNEGWVWSLLSSEDAQLTEAARSSGPQSEGTFDNGEHLQVTEPKGIPDNAEVF